MKAIVPIRPRFRRKPTWFGALDDGDEPAFAEGVDSSRHICKIAEFHHLSDHAIRRPKCCGRRTPPKIFSCEFRENIPAAPRAISIHSFPFFAAKAYFSAVSITLGSFTGADIGSTAYVKALQATAAQSNPDAPALNVLAGASEGDTIALVAGSGTDPTLAAEDAIGQSDFAIQQILAERAGLGAFSVRLPEDESNDALAALNLQASVSTIRDLNVGAASTRFTQSRIEEQVGTAVLAQANALPETFLALFR